VNPIIAKPQTLELFGAPGALNEVALELTRIFDAPWKPHKFQPRLEVQPGFVRVRGASWDLACEIAARASSVHEVRLALPGQRVQSWSDVPRLLERWPWEDILTLNEPLEVRAAAFSGALEHSERLQRTAEEFFQGYGFEGSSEEPFTRLDFVASGDWLRATVSLGNGALYKRGWRASTGSLATLREDLASAAFLRLSEFDPRAFDASKIVVPFAGSGTLGFEAWHALFGLPPAIWNVSRPWQRLVKPTPATQTWWRNRVARAAQEAELPPIEFIENFEAQLDELEANAEYAMHHLEKMDLTAPSISTQLEDAFDVPQIGSSGDTVLLPLHPPYGLRLARAQDTDTLYSRLGQQVRTWANEVTLIGFCLCPTESSWRAFRNGLEGFRLETSHVTQGGLDVRLCCFSK
jgi:23S rRNA G2445 N2-methylase RlmL